MAGWTTAVLAGVIGVMLMPALLTFTQISSHGFSAAGEYVRKGPFVARQHPVTELVQIFLTVFGYDLCQAAHG
jgi:hypothetical protein